MRYTFTDGLVLEGTFAQIREVARMIGRSVEGLQRPAGHYFSASNQDFLKITDMPSSHIRRAILKTMDKLVAELRTQERLLSDREFLLRLQNTINEGGLLHDLAVGLQRQVR